MIRNGGQIFILESVIHICLLAITVTEFANVSLFSFNFVFFWNRFLPFKTVFVSGVLGRHSGPVEFLFPSTKTPEESGHVGDVPSTAKRGAWNSRNPELKLICRWSQKHQSFLLIPKGLGWVNIPKFTQRSLEGLQGGLEDGIASWKFFYSWEKIQFWLGVESEFIY